MRARSKKVKKSHATTSTAANTVLATSTYTVTGMTCGHCVQAVTGELTKIDGVTSVDVALDTGTVTVTSVNPVGESAVRAAVEEAGYELAG